MSTLTAADLDGVSNFTQLVSLLRDKLDWPIDPDYGFEDVVYEYDAAELGLKKTEVAKIREIHQLRPLITDQPWGIFFISMEEKDIPVTILRRILRALVIKKRAVDQISNQRAWNKSDLIFAANFGKPESRQLTFVHFSDEAESGGLPSLKVLGWNERNTNLRNEYTAKILSEKLTWPTDIHDLETWRNTWASAFDLRYNEVIETSDKLSFELAILARIVRDRVKELLNAENEQGPMRSILSAFRKNLIHNLDNDGFADTFAQTIAYGMLAARISHPNGIVPENMADMVPSTNPFLREMFRNFLKLSGHDRIAGLDYNELGIRDVVEMLNAAKMDSVLRDFGDKNPKMDPVIYFYENFLQEYDNAQRVDAGVFYTPPAVVRFIVHAVDESLRKDFGLKFGLADITTWGELATRNSGIKIPDNVNHDDPFVQILDPATGTGTFLVEVIDLIHKRMMMHWENEKKTNSQITKEWNDYVSRHLLPRITGFEMQMAAYSIAHMKVGLKLSETNYGFLSGERVQVLLTNSMQPFRELDLAERGEFEALANEAIRSNNAKRKIPFTVVIGNPPYKGESMNLSRVNNQPTFAGKLIERFFKIRGEPLGEKNPKWVHNDYVKFFAFAMHKIEDSGMGVLGYITSNSWLDSRTFRGVRSELIDNFPVLYIVNLHGNTKRKEYTNDGSPDEGVFAITEGTNITVAIKGNSPSRILQTDLIGNLEYKIEWLEKSSLDSVDSALKPSLPMLLLTNDSSIGSHSNSGSMEFYNYKSIKDIFPVSSVGIVTSKDKFCIQFTRGEIEDVISQFIEIDLMPILLERENRGGGNWKLDIVTNPVRVFLENKRESQDWRVEYAQANVMSTEDWRKNLMQINYRPFDSRYTFYSNKQRGFLCRPRGDVMQHMMSKSNIGLISTQQRSQMNGDWANVFVSDRIIESTAISNKTKEINSLFPLWLQPESKKEYRHPNIDKIWAIKLSKSIGLEYIDGTSINNGESNVFPFASQTESLDALQHNWDGIGDLKSFLGPRDIFDYIYSVLHCASYRRKYSVFLKSDFPHIPIPKDNSFFSDMVLLGRKLVSLHLLRCDEVDVLVNPPIAFLGTGDAFVDNGYPQFRDEKVLINNYQWFDGISNDVWDYQIGGYQVCKKWLSDRSGKGGKNPVPSRSLSGEDIIHYKRIVVSLAETIKTICEIDETVLIHGGWNMEF